MLVLKSGYDFHLESCTPGQDQAKWYVRVRTSTHWYVLVHISKKCNVNTYQDMLVLLVRNSYNELRHVLFSYTQAALGEKNRIQLLI